MTAITPITIASRLANIWTKNFSGKAKGRFRLYKEDIRRISGRSRLEDGVIAKITMALYKDHDLALLRIDDEEFFVDSVKSLRGWRETPAGIITAEARRKRDLLPMAVKTVKNEAAAWPFPTGTKP